MSPNTQVSGYFGDANAADLRLRIEVLSDKKYFH